MVMESSTLAEIVQILVSIHKTQHQALVVLCMEQQQCFQALLQTQKIGRCSGAWSSQRVPQQQPQRLPWPYCMHSLR